LKVKQDLKNKPYQWSRISGFALLLFICGASLGVTSAEAQARDPLAGLKLANTEIVSAKIVAAGAFKPPHATTTPGE
jgi:hypothetical protein